MNKTDLKLYAITDRQWLHKARLSEHVKLAIEGGATMIQIRDKDILSTDSDAGLKDEYNEALEIKRICHEHKVPLIINDNVQFAIDIAADGVHLGQDDMNPAEARKLLGTDKIIGVTPKPESSAMTRIKYKKYLIIFARNDATAASILLLSNPFLIIFTTDLITLIPISSITIATTSCTRKLISDGIYFSRYVFTMPGFSITCCTSVFATGTDTSPRICLII